MSPRFHRPRFLLELRRLPRSRSGGLPLLRSDAGKPRLQDRVVRVTTVSCGGSVIRRGGLQNVLSQSKSSAFSPAPVAEKASTSTEISPTSAFELAPSA